jgi:hypothetical protein
MLGPKLCALAGREIVVALMASAVFFAGCASTKLDAQWIDPQFKGRSLLATKVFVVCEATDVAIKHVCQDRVAAQVTAVGATPVKGPETDNSTPAPQPVADPYLPAAREAGANTILSTAVTPDATIVNPGPSIGFGVGGFGGGGGAYRAGSVGMSVPVGAGQVITGYAANTTLTDVATGRLMWTARATTPPSKDINMQVTDLAKAVLDGAKKEGFF